MGVFSFMYANDMKNRTRLADNEQVYLLSPNNEAYKGRYDGYGNIASIDVYEHLVEINKNSLFVQLLTNKNIDTKNMSPWLFRCAILYGGEKGTEELVEECINMFHKDDNNLKYKLSEWKRLLGIELYFNSNESKGLDFPLKITSKPMDYASCEGYSASDPLQGCD